MPLSHDAPPPGPAPLPSLVLLVDDQPVVAVSLRRLVADAPDIAVEACHTPGQALEQALRLRPHVVLLDLIMPNVDGMTVLRFFKRHAILKHVPVMVLASQGDPDRKAQAFENGAVDYVAKLPDAIELIARIRYHAHSYRIWLERETATHALAALHQQVEKLKAGHGQSGARQSPLPDFLARVCQEPLTTVVNAAELLLKEAVPVDVEDLNRILQAAHHLRGIIHDVLEMSRPDIDIQVETFAVATVVRAAVAKMEPRLADRNNRLDLHSAPNLGDMTSDARRVRQILVRLLTQANANTQDGVLTLRAAAEGEEVVFTVSDVGSAELEPFVGAGLGLAIARRLCDRLGGRISGTGDASLTVTLPRSI